LSPQDVECRISRLEEDINALHMSLQAGSRLGRALRPTGNSGLSREDSLRSLGSSVSGSASVPPLHAHFLHLLAEEREQRKQVEKRLSDMQATLSNQITSLSAQSCQIDVVGSTELSTDLRFLTEELQSRVEALNAKLDFKFSNIKTQLENSMPASHASSIHGTKPSPEAEISRWHQIQAESKAAAQDLATLEEKLQSVEESFNSRCEALETQIGILNATFLSDMISDKIQEHNAAVDEKLVKLQANIEFASGDTGKAGLKGEQDALRLSNVEQLCSSFDLRMSNIKNSIAELVHEKYSELAAGIHENGASTTSLIEARSSSLQASIDSSCTKLEVRLKADFEKALNTWRQSQNDQLKSQVEVQRGVDEIRTQVFEAREWMEQECSKLGVRIGTIQLGAGQSLEQMYSNWEKLVEDKCSSISVLLHTCCMELESKIGEACDNLEARMKEDSEGTKNLVYAKFTALTVQIEDLQAISAEAVKNNNALESSVDARCDALDTRISALNTSELLGRMGTLNGRVNDMQILLERRCSAVETQLCTLQR